MFPKQTLHSAIVHHHPDGSRTIHLGPVLQGATKASTPIGASCLTNDQCVPGTSGQGACGRPNSTANHAQMICCQSGKNDLYDFMDFCTEMPNGQACYTNAMCASGFCNQTDSGGFCRATNSVPNGEYCNSDSDCKSGYCQSRIFNSSVCASKT